MLRAKNPTQKGDVKPQDINSSLKSALANRQWAQVRCVAAGFGVHNRCMLCVGEGMVAERDEGNKLEQSEIAKCSREDPNNLRGRVEI